ncbi:hypothetical protein DPMN_013449 [Dreissena polymorpha]|uniref:Uncharacterized protein n=1 Tax=Dreissena polymorpha TaxID=45954 RepID=A0A9D4S3P5_DREPO|nr:hypothetical protein DPMN_013449 [Dreissena polymorpha]
MTVARPDVQLQQDLQSFQLHVVVVILGGNYISTSSSTADIVSSLLRLQTHLNKARTTHVHFCTISERGYCPKDRLRTKKCFNAQQNKINDCLRKTACVLQVNKISFPADYDTCNTVHFN